MAIQHDYLAAAKISCLSHILSVFDRDKYYIIYQAPGGIAKYMRYDGEWFVAMNSTSRVFHKPGGTYFDTHEEAADCLRHVCELAAAKTKKFAAAKTKKFAEAPPPVLFSGQYIDAIFCKEAQDGSCSGGAVGIDRVTAIRITDLPGPTGRYFVAVITRRVDDPEDIIPIHAAEVIRTLPGDSK